MGLKIQLLYRYIEKAVFLPVFEIIIVVFL